MERLFGWMRGIDFPHAEPDGVFVCGVDIEVSTGVETGDFVRAHPELVVFFAPVPRLMSIERERIEAILACSPMLRMNKAEAFEYTGETEIERAGTILVWKTFSALASGKPLP